MKMRMLALVAAAGMLVPSYLMTTGTAWADDHPPKHDDNGCCFQFDNSPVNLVFCTTPNACQFEGTPENNGAPKHR